MKGDLDKVKVAEIPEHQPDATLDQATPVQNTWYTVIDETNARIYMANVTVQTLQETLHAKLTIDGNVYEDSGIAGVAGDPYYLRLNGIGGLWDTTNLDTILSGGGYVEGRAVKLEVRKTTANGTGNLQGRVTWAKIGGID